MSTRDMHCRGCNGTELQPVLDLGKMPLVNSLLDEGDLRRAEPRYPLELVFCPRCALVQITETIPPEKLFGDYTYFSSVSDTMVGEAKALAERLIAERRLDGSSLVLELASNDGYLLQHYAARKIPVLGIEPAANVARVAERDRKIPTMVAFFTAALSERLRRSGVLADVIHANNVLAHVPDPCSFLRGMERVLRDGGVAIVEVPHVIELVDKGAFDTIYHEHLCYFSLTSLQHIADKRGLFVRDVERLPIHGGSLRVYLQKQKGRGMSDRARALLDEERAWGVLDVAPYRRLAGEIERIRRGLLPLLSDLKSKGHKIAAYGASAKGCVLLNHLGIGHEIVDFVVDKSVHKQGRFVPGVRTPILPPERLLADMPDDVLLLAWNIEAEVMEQQAEYRRRGGRFLVPVPEPRFVT
jgi:2-polyprenyl-3-methyl-5-hydroxy-6-metoxy-1,4-benzoquinol methylase